MKAIIKRCTFGILFAVLAMIAPLQTQAQTTGVSVTCDDGTSFDNGVEFVVNQMRPGFSYTATAIGIDGFDPVLAVLDNRGRGLCNDDEPDASDFEVDLPTTGQVEATSRSAQVVFSQTSGQMADVSLVVGGFNNQSGSFVLLLEGMAATTADGAGDPFSVRATENLFDSGVALTTYMIGVPNSVDSLMYLANPDLTAISDDDGEIIQCDDAGNASLCWNEGERLQGHSVSRTNGRVTNADSLDSMISLDVGTFSGQDVDEDLFFTFVMARATSGTGDYVVAFHAGTSVSGEAVTAVEPTATPSRRSDTPTRPDSESAAGGGVSVTCDDGTTFENGVEFVVNQMRPGFTYTATAIGIDGFDPVLAVLDEDGNGLCNDDSSNAETFFANLPTSGSVLATSRSAQIRFSQDMGAMADVSLVVGGYDNAPGQFVLLLEGMAATDADGLGDPFSVRLTPDLLQADIPLTVYMIGVDGGVDPLMYLADVNLEAVTDDNGDRVRCDDAGNESLCWGNSSALNRSSVARTNRRSTDGESTDAMISLPMEEFSGVDFDSGPLYLTFMMTRFEGSITGNYLVAFHTEAK